MLDRHVKKTTRGGGLLAIFGLPFLFMGLFFMIGPWFEGEPGAVAFSLFALPFVGIGAALVFGRSGVVVDLRRRQVTSWWGLLVPFSRRSRPIEQFRHVSISREVRRTKNSNYTVYPVRLVGRGPNVDVEEPRKYERARRIAEEYAKLMDLGVRDRAGEQEIVREAGSLDEPLRDRLLRTGRIPEAADPPLGARTMAKRTETESEFLIPSPGFRAVHYAGLALGWGFGAALYWFVFPAALSELAGERDAAGLVTIAAALFCAGPVVGAIVLVFADAMRWERIAASRDRLRLETRQPFRRRTREIPVAELEEVELFDGGGRGSRPNALIAARSDRTSFEFGRALERQEREWLRDAIIRAIAS